MNDRLHPVMATALAPFAPPSEITALQEQVERMRLELQRLSDGFVDDVVKYTALRAENAALRDELQRAVGECCNQYFDDGHYARVQRLYGIDLDMLKVLGNAL